MDQLISGLLVSIVTEVAKRIQAVPLSDTQVGRIRIVAGVLSALSVLVDAFLRGQLAQVNFMNLGLGTVGVYIMSVLAYHGIIRGSFQKKSGDEADEAQVAPAVV